MNFRFTSTEKVSIKFSKSEKFVKIYFFVQGEDYAYSIPLFPSLGTFKKKGMENENGINFLARA